MEVFRIRTLTVFNPSMCCSTCVCGSDVEQALINFSVDLQWLKGSDVQIKGYSLTQQPIGFVQKAKTFPEASGAEELTLLLLDSKMVCSESIIQNALKSS